MAWAVMPSPPQVLAKIIHSHDVGMGKARSALCFAVETYQKSRIHDVFVAQRLDGHQTSQGHVLRLVDLRQAPLSNLCQKLIAVVEDGQIAHSPARGCIVPQNRALSKR